MERIDAFVTFSTELAKKKPASLYSTNKSRYIRYILRHEALILTVLEGYTVGGNHRGREILEMLVELMGGGTCEEEVDKGQTDRVDPADLLSREYTE